MIRDIKVIRCITDIKLGKQTGRHNHMQSITHIKGFSKSTELYGNKRDTHFRYYTHMARLVKTSFNGNGQGLHFGFD